MKKNTLLVLLLTGFLTTLGQPGILKIHAWKQAGSLPGTRQTQISENNEILETKKASRPIVRLFIDMAVKAPIQTDMIWVEGKAYKTIEEKRGRSAIIYKTAGLGTGYKIDTLAPATTAYRKEIRVGSPVKQLIRVPNNTAATGIWIRYWWKGKQYLQEVKKISELPEQVLE